MLFSSTARKSNQVLSSNGRFAKKFEILPRNKQKLIKQPSESMESTTETADQREGKFFDRKLDIYFHSVVEMKEEGIELHWPLKLKCLIMLGYETQ